MERPRTASSELPIPKISDVVLGGSSPLRLKLINSYFPGALLHSVPTPEEPNHTGSRGVVDFKLNEAIKKAPPYLDTSTTLYVAGDVMVSRPRPNGTVQENLGKYPGAHEVFADLEHMVNAHREDPSIPPFYRIQSASGIQLDGRRQTSERHYTVTLDPERLAHFAQREVFGLYLVHLASGGNGTIQSIAGGLELEYLVAAGCVVGINGISIKDNAYPYFEREATHFAKVGIDPILFDKLK